MGLTLGQRRILDSRSINLVDAIKEDLGPQHAQVAAQILRQIKSDITKANTTFIDGLGKFGVGRRILERGCGKMSGNDDRISKLCSKVLRS